MINFKRINFIQIYREWFLADFLFSLDVSFLWNSFLDLLGHPQGPEHRTGVLGNRFGTFLKRGQDKNYKFVSFEVIPWPLLKIGGASCERKTEPVIMIPFLDIQKRRVRKGSVYLSLQTRTYRIIPILLRDFFGRHVSFLFYKTSQFRTLL